VIFSFSKTAGNDARSWNERLSKDFPKDVPSFTIIMLESVPKLFRGMALSGIKGSMPIAMQDRTLVLYRDETLMNTIPPPSNKKIWKPASEREVALSKWQ